MNYLPLILVAAVFVVMLAVSARNRRRTAVAEIERAERIGVGTDVMTTSGLHGTVVAKNADDTVMLSIAPGVEVRWELAALRDTASLPERYVHDTPDTAEDTTADSVDRDLLRRGVDLDKSDKASGADPAA